MNHLAPHILRPIAFALAILVAAPSVATARFGNCGQPFSEGRRPAITDALMILRVSVGLDDCDELTGDELGDCICDVDDNGKVNVGDVIRVLLSALGIPRGLHCRNECNLGSTTTTTFDGQTTTTVPNTTSTTLFGTTSTTLDGSTTTTLGNGSTTTTLGEGGTTTTTLGDGGTTTTTLP